MWRLTFPANAQFCPDHANSYQNAVASSKVENWVLSNFLGE
jgi:hypothetical protein